MLGPAQCVAALLAVVSGYVDVLCVLRHGVFPATQTGNLIFLGCSLWSGNRALAPEQEDVGWLMVVYRLLVIVASAAGALAYCAFEHHFPEASASSVTALLASLVLMADLLPWVLGVPCTPPPGHWDELGLRQWCVLFIAFALGAVNYLCSPTSSGSRLKAVTFAATGHMHELLKGCWSTSFVGQPLTESERADLATSGCAFFGLFAGAILGAVAYHSTALCEWSFEPVALLLLLALCIHDRGLSPPGGDWTSSLREPLHMQPTPARVVVETPTVGARQRERGATLKPSIEPPPFGSPEIKSPDIFMH
jgi:uncharacterized membrane protein YoaK (UPF0700 family)